MVGAGIHVPLHGIQCRPAPGGRWRSSGLGGQDGKFQVVGEIVEIDPPHSLVYTWVASWTGDVKTTVRWELDAVGEGTLLRLRHCGLAEHPETAQSYRGWPSILGWIRAFVEQGETVETRMA
jgi:uncharacterized protein YndB with AHSA1/START domain